MTFQISVKLRLSKVLGVLGFVTGVVALTCQVYQTELAKDIKARESHDLCHDTPTQYAWVAYRDKEARCFLEYKEFPHKSKGFNLDNSFN